jgi:hypothetical protein
MSIDFAALHETGRNRIRRFEAVVFVDRLCGGRTVTQENKQEKQNGNDLCGWVGVEVRPMTSAFAASLGMAVPYQSITLDAHRSCRS